MIHVNKKASTFSVNSFQIVASVFLLVSTLNIVVETTDTLEQHFITTKRHSTFSLPIKITESEKATMFTYDTRSATFVNLGLAVNVDHFSGNGSTPNLSFGAYFIEGSSTVISSKVTDCDSNCDN